METLSKYRLISMIRSGACQSLLLALILGGVVNVDAAGQAATGSGVPRLSVPPTKGNQTTQPPPVRSGLPICPIPDPEAVPARHHMGGTHKVTLSWTASAPSLNSANDPVGYCVYRRKENQSGKKVAAPNSTFAGRERINPLPVRGTTCVDDDVEDDALYSYVVTAVNASGIPNSPSNEVDASIPAEKPINSARQDAPSCRGTLDERLRSRTD